MYVISIIEQSALKKIHCVKSVLFGIILLRMRENTKKKEYLYRYSEDVCPLVMRLNCDYCSATDNGCIVVMFIMGCVQVCVARVALIYLNSAMTKN